MQTTCTYISDSPDDFQVALHILHNNTKQFGMKISPLKSKMTAVKRHIPIKRKIEIDNATLEQVQFINLRICDVNCHMKREGRTENYQLSTCGVSGLWIISA
jgi:predicted acetyltransferase